MTDEERARLGETLRATRLKRGLSSREVARRAGVDSGTVSLLERGKINQPRVESVRSIAEVLLIPLADIYAMLRWLPARELPTFRPYMRAKYRDLSDSDLKRVEEFIAGLSIKSPGPRRHEDEYE